FVKEQIAGDLLAFQRVTADGKQLETPVATGLFGLGEERNGATDLGEVRAEKMDSRIDVFGKAFLGLTVACARCHDHKFDPISTGGLLWVRIPTVQLAFGGQRQTSTAMIDSCDEVLSGAKSERAMADGFDLVVHALHGAIGDAVLGPR